jgi:hypothetical protein
MCGTICKYSADLIIDELYCIEAQQDDELPERPLMVQRSTHVPLTKAMMEVTGKS